MRSGWKGLLRGVLTVGLVLVAASPALAVAPVGKHYVTVLLFIDPDIRDAEAQIGCLSFTRDEVCTESDACGSFEFIDKLGVRNLWRGNLDMVDEGTVEFEGYGMTERRGRGSSIGGTALLTSDGVTINASFAGIQAPLADCLEAAASDDE